VPVEGVADSGTVETVYNFEVEEYHTYFVSASEAGVSVWAHNQNYKTRKKGRSIQVLKPSKSGPNRWQTLIKIPKNAKETQLKPVAGGAQKGVQYTWKDAKGKKWTVRIHDADPSAPAGSNAASGWTVRIIRGNRSMDISGNFHPPGIFNPNSPFYDPAAINNIHIPIAPLP